MSTEWTCPICGGIKPLMPGVMRTTPFTTCPGHPEPETVERRGKDLSTSPQARLLSEAQRAFAAAHPMDLFTITVHPEPAPKHDGKLTVDPDRMDHHEYIIEWQDTNWGNNRVIAIDDTQSPIPPYVLWPDEALRLRDWLIQESPDIERLVKEQESVAENEKTISLPPPFLDISKRPDMDWLSTIKIRPTITDVHERTKEQGQ